MSESKSYKSGSGIYNKGGKLLLIVLFDLLIIGVTLTLLADIPLAELLHHL
jgi:hypothetical protein